MCIGLHLKYPLLFSDFNASWLFPRRFLGDEILNYQISWKSVQWKARISMQTDKHDKGNKQSVFAVLRTRLTKGSSHCPRNEGIQGSGGTTPLIKRRATYVGKQSALRLGRFTNPPTPLEGNPRVANWVGHTTGPEVLGNRKISFPPPVFMCFKVQTAPLHSSLGGTSWIWLKESWVTEMCSAHPTWYL
jgi:hypothetical protein